MGFLGTLINSNKRQGAIFNEPIKTYDLAIKSCLEFHNTKLEYKTFLSRNSINVLSTMKSELHSTSLHQMNSHDKAKSVSNFWTKESRHLGTLKRVLWVFRIWRWALGITTVHDGRKLAYRQVQGDNRAMSLSGVWLWLLCIIPWSIIMLFDVTLAIRLPVNKLASYYK